MGKSVTLYVFRRPNCSVELYDFRFLVDQEVDSSYEPRSLRSHGFKGKFLA